MPLGQPQHQRRCQFSRQAHDGHGERHPEKRDPRHCVPAAGRAQGDELLQLLQVAHGPKEQTGRGGLGGRGGGAGDAIPFAF